jgi:glutaredoxin 3
MAKVEMYTSPFCPYCTRAKSLLQRKGIQYEEIDVISNPSRREEMMKRANGRTSVPQIFVDGQGLGGSDDIHALDRKGELDRILGIGA